jgi:hypothetical protein
MPVDNSPLTYHIQLLEVNCYLFTFHLLLYLEYEATGLRWFRKAQPPNNIYPHEERRKKLWLLPSFSKPTNPSPTLAQEVEQKFIKACYR